MSEEKQLTNPFSTGGGGHNFETHIQAVLAVLMLTGGFAPCLPLWPIKKIKLQGKYAGYNIDDCIVFTREPNSDREAKLLSQIKHSLSISEGSKPFGDVIKAAWHDFCNPQLFNPERDAIAVITGQLNASDVDNVVTLLDWARHSENASEFISKVQKANFSNNQKRSKLKAFRVHLRQANGSDVSEDELWRFIKSFHLLGYDLDIRAGVTLSLLQSMIAQYNPDNAQKLWLQVVEEVKSANQDAGTLTIETISPDIRDAFKRSKIRQIPVEFVKNVEKEAKTDFMLIQYSTELALTTLIGAWDESSEYDRKAVEKLSSIPYREWVEKVRDILAQPNSPLIQKNRKWKITKRFELWSTLSSRIFDEHLDRFKDIAVNVLREHDPKFELPSEERFAARVHGKVLSHSPSLRNGLAEGLALLGSHPKALTSCSLHRPEGIAALAVHEILDGSDWVIWASLNDVLPLLAEGDPNEFLKAGERILNDKDNKVFQSLFAQEGSGIGGWNYVTGILWALETLAWHQDYLARVTVLLGQLAEVDPGGNWANRPINSLTTIFLPWLPQTCASIEIRKVAVEALLKECPAIGWKLLLALLPNAHQMTSGSRKPKWREFIPNAYLEKLLSNEAKVSSKDYFQQVDIYTSLAFQHAKSDLTRLKELVYRINDLPEAAYSEILEHLSSKEILISSEADRLCLWESLTEIISKHRKFSGAKWALPETKIDNIENIANALKPSSPNLIYRRLFSQYENQLYDEKDNFEDQRRKIESQRTKAIEEILGISDISGVVDFATMVKFPLEVGRALGRVGQVHLDHYFLPIKLTVENRILKDVVVGYISSRFIINGWKWANELDMKDWTKEQKAAVLVILPFCEETWQRAQLLLGESVSLYWKQADARPYQLKEDLQEATEKLLQYQRPRAAIQCLSWMLYEKMEPPLEQTYQALLQNVTSEERANSIDEHDLTELIKWLQHNPNADRQKLYQIEWIYLELLDHYLGLAPVALEERLTTDPRFFCEVIRIVFRSEKQGNDVEEITEQRKQIATRAYDLLRNWQTPPGTKHDGSFDDSVLRTWIAEVKQSCEHSGHLKIALDQIGKVFAHYRPDPDGLWIHKSIAEMLNERDSDEMRSAFNVERFNMRGTFTWTAGEDEKKYAADYRQKADAVEKEGYFRFAASLREFAASYDRDAEREESHDPFEL